MQPLIHDAPPNPSTTGDDNRPVRPLHAPVCAAKAIVPNAQPVSQILQSGHATFRQPRNAPDQSAPVSGFTPGPLLREYTTVYALNADGVNRFSALVQPGFDDDHNRTSDAECQRIAALMQAAPDLLASLKEMHEAAASGDFYADYDEALARCGRARAAIAKATGSANQVTE